MYEIDTEKVVDTFCNLWKREYIRPIRRRQRDCRKGFARNVRLDPSSKVIRDKNNAELQLSAMMFYDCKNSRPVGMKFRTDDIIIFNGVNHRIETVEPLYDDKRIHHWELGLVRCG